MPDRKSDSKLFVATESIQTLREHVAAAKKRGELVGCVPTMGALHAGHLSLVEAARKQCDFVAVTIFVNPTQFGPNEDFDQYPRPLDDDLKACREAGVDLVFHPSTDVVYPTGAQTFVTVEGLSTVLEGACRPGHFRGVTTVVTQLFNMVQPDVAFFGRKDYQQQLMIRQMCRDLHIPVRIETCPTVRESDGLALSSRNAYLSPSERSSALLLSKALFHAEKRCVGGEQALDQVQQEMLDLLNSHMGVQVEYAVIANPETLEVLSTPQPEMIALIAARVGQTRLIDNLPIQL